MKQVKECPECGRYNIRRREVCEKCGCRLDGVQITEVDDNLTENPDFGLIVQPQDDGQNAFLDEQTKKYACKNCGTEYTVEHPDRLQVCVVCRHIVYNPFKKKADTAPFDGVEGGETEGRTVIASQGKTLRFLSAAGKGCFLLAFGKERKSFGRSTCSEEYISANNYISRAHITYFLKDGKAFVVDTSVNGTFINGMRLKYGEEYPLEAGDRIRFYNEEFIVEDGN